VHKPSIQAYLPATPNGASVVIAPGGGHRELWADHEGHHLARWLSEHGVAAFVLHYRLAREKESGYTIEGHALADTQRAIRVVRSRSAEWKLDPERIGVMGFSAGGELAALAGTRYEAANETAPDAVDRLSSRPAFQALVYPAIPKGLAVTAKTPRTFLVHADDDRLTAGDNSVRFYLALKQAGVPAEIGAPGTYAETSPHVTKIESSSLP